jgi:hypothetical protein
MITGLHTAEGEIRIGGYGRLRIRPAGLVATARWLASDPDDRDPNAKIIECVKTVDGLGELEPELMSVIDMADLILEIRPAVGDPR